MQWHNIWFSICWHLPNKVASDLEGSFTLVNVRDTTNVSVHVFSAAVIGLLVSDVKQVDRAQNKAADVIIRHGFSHRCD